MHTELAVTGAGGRRKTVKRTKGGLLPWWVRKRLQEQSEPEQKEGKGGSDAKHQPASDKESLHTSVEVYACLALCQVLSIRVQTLRIKEVPGRSVMHTPKS